MVLNKFLLNKLVLIIFLASLISGFLSNFEQAKAYVIESKNHYQLTEINYKISFSKPFTHYCEVEINLKDFNKDSLIFSMPVWTPGSYLIREFSKNVEDVKAFNSKGDSVAIDKINKNSWRAETKNQSEINFKYKVYCNEISVRTSEINNSHAFISNSGVFMFIKGFENLICNLSIQLPEGWSKISTGLTKESDAIFSAENYDIFIDSPLEIGNQEILEFEIKGIKHYICLSGKGNYDKDTIINDFKKIAEEEIKLFGGDIPYKDYTFIIQLVENGGGGLEHLNSFVAQTDRFGFSDDKKYKRFLGLVSHEFFHLWNVKRIRPEALGPFDYEKENYTKALWVAEGWTSFYDNLILRRSGILDDKGYFEFIEKEINDIMSFEGRFHQSAEESSFDTWIKFYRRDENFNNRQVSYYTKGALIAMMLNLEIILSTDSEKSLDDVLRLLYKDYKDDTTKGYTDERVKELSEKVSGKKLDDFWNKFVIGKDEIPLDKYFESAGLILENENEEQKSSLDVDTRTVNGKLVISQVYSGGSGYESGLNSGDEIIAINDVRMNNDLLKSFFKNESPGNEVKVLISRKGLIEDIKVRLLKPLPKYKVISIDEIKEGQNKILRKWLDG